MSSAKDCRLRAQRCRALAAHAIYTEARLQWLNMAQYWTKRALKAENEDETAPDKKEHPERMTG